MSRAQDYLYELLPVIYRMQDADRGYPLRALLRVLGEQLAVVEADISGLYENWFIETAEDWVVPYLGELVGYQPLHDGTQPGAAGQTPSTAQEARSRFLAPRSEVAHTVNFRRRKGTLALLETLARDVAAWPAHAVEGYTLLGWTQHLNHQRPLRGRSAELRMSGVLDGLGGEFDRSAHAVDVRRPVSGHSRGRYNIPSIGLYVSRLKSYSVTDAPACCVEKEGSQCFTFSVLGNDAPLFTNPAAKPALNPASDAQRSGAEQALPLPIGRLAFEQRTSLRPPAAAASPSYYGPGLSLSVLAAGWKGQSGALVPAGNIIPADLGDWHAYRAPRNKVLLDPVRGRMVFPTAAPPKSVSVNYHYGFSTEMGGGEYQRTFSEPAAAVIYRVRKEGRLPGEFARVTQAYEQWVADRAVPGGGPGQGSLPRAAVIEIMDSRAYEERFEFALTPGESLQLRAANGVRPVLRLLDYRVDQPDPFSITGGDASRFTLDGLLVVGRGIEVNGPQSRRTGDDDPTAGGDLCDVVIRHCTLVPGWNLDCDCGPQRPEEPSLSLHGTLATVKIQHSILGSISVESNERPSDPPSLMLADSILDAADVDGLALCDPTGGTAFTALTIARCTVVGEIRVHAVERADDTIFLGPVRAARRQVGCVRFCYLAPGSRTPRRHHCQPDLVRQAVADRLNPTAGGQAAAPDVLDAAADREALRVRPVFTSLRYGNPAYGQLGQACAPEIAGGASDESDMGSFHDLYQPQRAANLRTRLDEYTVAGFETGIFYTS